MQLQILVWTRLILVPCTNKGNQFPSWKTDETRMFVTSPEEILMERPVTNEVV